VLEIGGHVDRDLDGEEAEESGELDDGIERDGGGVFEGIADGVADDGGGVQGRVLHLQIDLDDFFWRCPKRRRHWP